ncbi:hypothetical protein WMF20_00670 [Sorangium sp. So ce834]|uniref:hypothetical protein n=1 Tax=Sorangium sp. So ce834 TaxID=3133321 RepID=UPI003F5FACC1
MEPHPFRQPAERPTAPFDEPRLGKLRAVHAVHRRYALFHAGRGALLLTFTSIFGAFIAGWQGFLRSLPFGLAGSSVLAAWALRRRGLRIALHDHGIVVDRRQGRDVTVFDGVDEVWLDRTSTPLGAVGGQTVFPWRKVRLDRVPRPTVFAKLAVERAPRVERDEVWAAWTG